MHFKIQLISILASLVRAGGKTRSAMQRTLANSLGFWIQIDEEIKRRVDLLVNRGELTAEEAIRFTKKLLSIQNIFEVNEVPSPDLREIEEMLKVKGVPTREEFEILLSKLDKLSEMIDEITR
jgi:polyhydroxyalkanoate synthesis regulator phasin